MNEYLKTGRHEEKKYAYIFYRKAFFLHLRDTGRVVYS